MAIFKCEQYPQLRVWGRDGTVLAQFRDGLFATDDASVIAMLSQRAYITLVDDGGQPAASGRRRTFRREYVKCGKPSCRCASGRGHGPYIYAYYREGGRVRKRYIGRAAGQS